MFAVVGMKLGLAALVDIGIMFSKTPLGWGFLCDMKSFLLMMSPKWNKSAQNLVLQVLWGVL